VVSRTVARVRRTRIQPALAALLGFAVLFGASAARAEDGSNDVCPATSVDADDVRDDYDAEGRWTHELRLAKQRVVEEIAVSYRDDHAVARTEITPGHRRTARTYFDGDHVVVAECYEDGQRVGYASYAYDADDHLVLVDKRLLVKPTAEGTAPSTETWTRETTHHAYDKNGELVLTEVRDGTGRVKARTRSQRAPRVVPIVLSLTTGGTYQSDTELYDFLGGIGIHRDPPVERYGSDPLEVALDAAYRFHRASGTTSTDQTTLRLAVDYHDIVPRITLFTFATTDRNLPVNLRLNLELAVLGVKFDLVPPRKLQLDVSFAPVWNFRSIHAPTPAPNAPYADETTSKLRGSVRARAGLHFDQWSLVNSFEFLPTLYGDDAATEDDFWHRTVVRDTVSFDVKLSEHFTFHEVFKYTWDSAMRAQAQCPDGDNPLCLGYAFSSTTALSLNLGL
jgi:hypothetical protein